MKIEEKFQVLSCMDRVWDFVTDPKKMASCLPSVQSVEVLDDCHYVVTIKQKIGFISATFRIQTEVVEKQPPFKMVLSNKGKTILGAHGLLKSTDTVILTAPSEGSTDVHVISELTLGGQLATLGAKLIGSKSKEIFAEATANLKRELESFAVPSSISPP